MKGIMRQLQQMEVAEIILTSIREERFCNK